MLEWLTLKSNKRTWLRKREGEKRGRRKEGKVGERERERGRERRESGRRSERG